MTWELLFVEPDAAARVLQQGKGRRCRSPSFGLCTALAVHGFPACFLHACVLLWVRGSVHARRVPCLNPVFSRPGSAMAMNEASTACQRADVVVSFRVWRFQWTRSQCVRVSVLLWEGFA